MSNPRKAGRPKLGDGVRKVIAPIYITASHELRARFEARKQVRRMTGCELLEDLLNETQKKGNKS